MEPFVQKYFTKLSQLGSMKTFWGTNSHKYVIKATDFKHSFVVTLKKSSHQLLALRPCLQSCSVTSQFAPQKVVSVRSLQAVIKPKTANWTDKQDEKAMRGSNFPCQCVIGFFFLIKFELCSFVTELVSFPYPSTQCRGVMAIFHYLHARESENRQKSKGVRMQGITAYDK